MILQSFHFVVYHRAGQFHTVPDSLSRLPCSALGIQRIMIPDIVPDLIEYPEHPAPISSIDLKFLTVGSSAEQIAAVQFDHNADDIDGYAPFYVLNSEFVNQLKQYQAHDPELIPLILYMRDAHISSDPRVAKQVMKRSKMMSLTNGLLVQHSPQSHTPRRILLPNSPIRNQIIEHFHRHEFEGAHQGLDKTYERLSRRFSFRGM